MGSSWYTRLTIVLGVTIASLWFLVPSYYSLFRLPKNERNDVKLLQEKLPKWAPAAVHRLSLGLDLQGGIYMVMRVDTRTALQKRTERRALAMENALRALTPPIDVTSDTDLDKLQVTLNLKPGADLAKVNDVLSKSFGDFTKVSQQGNTITVQLQSAYADKFRTEAVEQAMLVIRRRIDKWGVAEVDVRKLGTDAIQISLPGQKDPEQAKELIGKTAQLEFRIVDDRQDDSFRALFDKGHPADMTLVRGDDGLMQLEAKDRQTLFDYTKGRIPAEDEVLLHCVESEAKKNQCASYRAYLVSKEVPLTGESLSGAQEQEYDNKIAVAFTLQPAAATDFENLTAKNTGRHLAIVLDENVEDAPVIKEKIPGGHGEITLNTLGKSLDEQRQDANTLAITLQSGALPAPVSIGEIRQVGASLGEELIKKGALAALMGLALVVIFMGVYYKQAGLVADVALILNAALILAGLALFNATLTLPGIAGFVLTLGIAVDANVLINERVREEVRNGKSPRAAVDQGYDRAFWTIFDAHVTTLIAGFILLSTGTGPVRGFATSLIIGLFASLFTSIVVTRVITTYFVHGRNAKTVSV